MLLNLKHGSISDHIHNRLFSIEKLWFKVRKHNEVDQMNLTEQGHYNMTSLIIRVIQQKCVWKLLTVQF